MSRPRAVLSLAVVILLALCVQACSADTIALYLKANGQDIKGDTTRKGREGSIECLYYEQGAAAPRDLVTGLATGKRTYQPLVVRKRIDAASPVLWKAFRTNQVIDAVFRFYRPSPVTPVMPVQFYTVEIHGGRIVSMRDILPDALTPATASQPPLEEVTFAFKTITWTFTDGGITDMDTVSAP
jgi:type VI secretion system secreted protein Hcp